MAKGYIINNKSDYGKVENYVSNNPDRAIIKRNIFNLKVQPFSKGDDKKVETYLNKNKISYSTKSDIDKY